MGKLESKKYYQNNFIMPNDFIDKGWIKLIKTREQMAMVHEIARFCFREGMEIGVALEKRSQKERDNKFVKIQKRMRGEIVDKFKVKNVIK